MTEYMCSVCEYTSPLRENVNRHINRKTSCGSGTREIIENRVEIKCEFCNKKFASLPNLKNHIKKTCKHKEDILKQRIQQLEKELKQAKTITNNNIDNSTNTTNYIIVINNYEDTSLDKLTDKAYNKIIKDTDEPYKMIPKLIKQIHFDPKTPENHNIYLSNRGKNNKHLQIYRNGHWEITDKNTEIDNLINDKETNISDWVAEKGQKYPEAMEKFNEYLDQKYDEDTAKLVKDEVELLLYNGRHIINKPHN